MDENFAVAKAVLDRRENLMYCPPDPRAGGQYTVKSGRAFIARFNRWRAAQRALGRLQYDAIRLYLSHDCVVVAYAPIGRIATIDGEEIDSDEIIAARKAIIE